MFTVKVFDLEGAYWAIACKSFRVLPPKNGSRSLQLRHEAGDDTIIKIGDDDKVIIENAEGKTIDVIRSGKRSA